MPKCYSICRKREKSKCNRPCKYIDGKYKYCRLGSTHKLNSNCEIVKKMTKKSATKKIARFLGKTIKNRKNALKPTHAKKEAFKEKTEQLKRDFELFKSMSVFELFELDGSATDAQIDKKLKLKSIKYHPDKHKGNEEIATKIFQLLGNKAEQFKMIPPALRPQAYFRYKPRV
jgi:hypothetical protein